MPLRSRPMCSSGGSHPEGQDQDIHVLGIPLRIDLAGPLLAFLFIGLLSEGGVFPLQRTLSPSRRFRPLFSRFFKSRE